jgi:DNA-binding NarL/FixJ family response regulator
MEEVLNTSLSLLGASAGHIRLFGENDVIHASSPMRMVAHRGFSQAYVDYFDTLATPLDGSAREGLFTGHRLIIEDMLRYPAYEPAIDVVINETYRAQQSTPLMNHDSSQCIGMISTYYLEVARPRPERLDSLDLYLALARAAIERQEFVAELLEKSAKLSSLVEKHRRSFKRVQERIRLIQRGAFTLEPSDFRRLALEALSETERALGDLEDPPPAAISGPVDTEMSNYGLSERELEVLWHTWRGEGDKQIASALGISRFTVAMHIRHILQKMALENRTQASVRAEREGLFAGLFD